jgi:hypothetical protein
MKLICATWNIATGSTGPGSGVRLRRRMAVLAELAPSVVALQFSDCRLLSGAPELGICVADMSATWREWVHDESLAYWRRLGRCSTRAGDGLPGGAPFSACARGFRCCSGEAS